MEVDHESGSFSDGLLLKIDDRQKLIFQKRFGFRESKEGISSVIAKQDGSFLLFGSTDTDTLIIELNSEGSVPGCSFSHNLKVSKVSFGSVKHENLAITPGGFSLPSPETLNGKIKRSTQPRRVCQLTWRHSIAGFFAQMTR